MKLRCTIGTQGLRDGRKISRGQEYEVNDVTARALIEAGYAVEVPKPVPAIKETIEMPKEATSALVKKVNHSKKRKRKTKK